MKKTQYIIGFLIIFFSQINAQNNFHDTQGNLEIGASGNVNYTLKIANPPTQGDFAPTIDLIYSSGQFGGIAGQGWSINGVSAIMRSSTRIDIDGFIDGVDFDDNDKLSINGQRLLLKSGSYFTAGAQYMTETQSNTKIEQFNTGASTYFVVTSPDGTRSWYGNYGGMNAIEHTAYYIVRQEDTDGNFITYHYAKPIITGGKSLCISEIRYSANVNNSLTPLNKIVFNYVKAIRSEFAYIGGEKKEKTELLSQITVFTNNLQFKKYILTHATDPQLGYQKITNIQEFNSHNEAANPVEFEYGNTVSTNANTQLHYQYNSLINIQEDSKLNGDFDGNGNLDILTQDKLLLNVLNPSASNSLITHNLPIFPQYGNKPKIL